MRILLPNFLRNFIINLFFKIKDSSLTIGENVRLNLNNRFLGNNSIGDNCSIGSSEIGFATYIASGSNIHYARFGKFCAIGKNIQICLGKHPLNFASIHPAFYSLEKQAGFTYASDQLFNEHDYVDDGMKYVVDVGNDVWIGNNVIIMDGISIGNGAVIATGSIVTKNIPDYAIVIGQPAKITRFRFSDSIISKLLDISWWDWEKEFIKKNSDCFTNVNDLISLSNEFKKN